MTMQAVGIDSRVFQRSREGSLFEALVDARAALIGGLLTQLQVHTFIN